MSAEDLATTIDPDIAAYGDVTIIGGFPKGAFDRIGIASTATTQTENLWPSTT